MNSLITNLSQKQNEVHKRAIGLARTFRRVEIELVEILQLVDQHKVFLTLGFTSLFEYTTKALNLSESVAYALITVSRKSIEVPELKMAIQAGEVSLARAKLMTSAINPQNAASLIEKAKVMTHRELEREIAKINPKMASPERAKYISESRLELKISITEEAMHTLRRVQDLEAQRTSSAVSFEQALEAMMKLYIEKKDPLAKSARVLRKPSAPKVLGLGESKPKFKNRSKSGVPKPLSTKEMVEGGSIFPAKDFSSAGKTKRFIPAILRHQISQRDQGQCTHIGKDGQRCKNRRWLEIHHKIPVHRGGHTNFENLTTLCSQHHRMEHAI